MDTPAPTSAPAARPPYGGGIEEFHWRSCFVRWSISVMGVALLLLSLYGLLTVPWMMWPRSSDAHDIDTASLSPEAQEMVREGRALAERNRWAGYLLAGALTAHFAFFLAVALWSAATPWTARRRARRRAVDWQTSRQASPYYVGDLLLLIVLGVVTWNLEFGLLSAAQVFLTRPGEGPWVTSASGIVWHSIGMAVLIMLLAAVRGRRHLRAWRLQVAAVPVLPGETVAFEVSGEDGRPLGAGLRLELVGNMISLSWAPSITMAWKAIFRQPIPGDVQADVAAAGQASSVRGTLRVDAAGLALAPPPGVKQPPRLFAFLRVRQGWWMKCLFEVPLPAVYVLPRGWRAAGRSAAAAPPTEDRGPA